LTLKCGDMFLWNVCQRTTLHCITQQKTLQCLNLGCLNPNFSLYISSLLENLQLYCSVLMYCCKVTNKRAPRHLPLSSGRDRMTRSRRGREMVSIADACAALTYFNNTVGAIYVILLAVLDPAVYSASNRNEYLKHEKKKCFWGVKCGWCVGLTTLAPSMSRLSRQCGLLNISRPSRPLTGIAFTPFIYRHKPVDSS
jgi:hypothetical protein